MQASHGFRLTNYEKKMSFSSCSVLILLVALGMRNEDYLKLFTDRYVATAAEARLADK